MEPGKYTRGKHQGLDDDTEGRHSDWTIMSIICLLAVVLAVLGIIFVTTLRLPKRSTDGADVTVGTLAPLNVPIKSVPDIMRPQEEPQPTAPAHVEPSRAAIRGGTCAASFCFYVGQRIRSKLDYNVDPCKDFYQFVCGTFRGVDQFHEIQQDIKISSISLLKNSIVPSTNQRFWQKASGMYKACVSFAKSKRNETKYLVDWMISLNLDLLNETTLATVNPVEMMVRASLDLGVHALLSIVLSLREFYYNKRLIKMEFSKEQYKWLVLRDEISEQKNLDAYTLFLSMYGATPPDDSQLASKVNGYEEQLVNILASTLYYGENKYVRTISSLGNFTKPYVTEGDWETFFYKYTNGTYHGWNLIVHQGHVSRILVQLFEDKLVGENGLRYLVAWSIYRQLVVHTVPTLLLHGIAPIEEHVTSVCYEHVRKVMNQAARSPYLHAEVTPDMVNQTQRIVATVRSTFRHSLESSSWLTGKVREGAIGKLDNITFYVGNPIKQFDLAFVEELYRPYPDAPLDKLFPTWIKALSLSTHHLWSDHTTWIYDETEVNAFYARADKYVVIPTGIMQRPFFYTNGPLGLNYGGLGTIVGHELMHAFDVTGITKNRNRWVTDEFLKKYTNRTLCLRNQHKSVLSVKARQEVLNGTLDSENLADFVGTMTAYAAFASLSSTRNNVTLAGLDMSPERLFFVNSCVKLCSQYGTLPALYASHRSRCIVPLMNMPEFSKAYGCAAGAPMNPRDKCTFW